METSINGEKKFQLNVRDKENQFNSNWNSGTKEHSIDLWVGMKGIKKERCRDTNRKPKIYYKSFSFKNRKIERKI